MSPTPPPERDPLQNLLEDTEDELRRRLRDACEAESKGLSTKSTEEIRQLEDNLLSAALAAKQTITVRRHMKSRALPERERPIEIDKSAARDVGANKPVRRKAESGANERPEKTDMDVREFTDERGRSWRAWPVIPGLSKASTSGRQFLGDFQNGWICFEGLGSSARRRLPYRDANWAGISDEELERLLEQAIDAPVRASKPRDKG
jgi:hypothetical protein